VDAASRTDSVRWSAVVAEDGLKAWIECREPGGSGVLPDLAEIISVLSVSKIPLTEAVRARVEEHLRLWARQGDVEDSREFPSRYLVAEGTAPTEPQDDALELDEAFRQTPSETASAGAVDPFARSMIKTVAAGATIGRIRRGRPGGPGQDVFGRNIPPRRKVGLQIAVGPGVKVAEDGALLAEAAGRLVVEKQCVRVEPRLEIGGDVDFDTGSLDVCVDVDVRGTVKANFRVRTTGSLAVGGAIEAAEVDVDGELRVRGGICGRERAGAVRVGGGITARFCNESNVQAGGDIWINAETLNSRVQTPGRFCSPAGTIIGGRVWARDGLEVGVLGSESGVTTSVAVGVSLAELREQRRLEEEMNGHIKVAAGIREKVAPLMANLKRLTSQQREAATELMCRADELDVLVDDLQARRKELLERSRPSGTPYVLVGASVHPGVRVAFGSRETRFDAVLHGPVRVEERKIEGATEIVALNRRTGSVTVLPSYETNL
jgi:uncharacterized protein (DUF342 family)